jgi:ankyrin repeat protein
MPLFLERGANLDVRYGSFGFLSHHASYHERTGVIQLLLDHEADLNARCSDAWTSLHWALAGGHADTAQFFLEYG